MDAGLDPDFDQPMAGYAPHPLIERVPAPGECEPSRKFLTDLCLSAHRLLPERDP